ncbi:MAG: 4'-phosphopantetheinyl transferase superfamily protein [Anaerolineae bacterium]|nr:4'-phosphopantetheinyl transferase superfamily protein [Anaerolineae bacterium]
MRVPKRREEWLHGRLTAKRLVQHCRREAQGLHLRDIVIAAKPGGAPCLLIQSRHHPASISISHREHLAVSAYCPSPHVSLGIDLEHIEPRSPGFIQDFFTSSEAKKIQSVSASQQEVLANLIWSAKESVLKALGIGLRMDTRQVEVIHLDTTDSKNSRDGAWHLMEVHCPSLPGCRVWWQKIEDFVLTMAVQTHEAATCELIPVRI